jgi:transcriptional regulator with GAF, ATPase, and Fis domain
MQFRYLPSVGSALNFKIAYNEVYAYKPLMLLAADYTPEFESLTDKLVELAQVRHVQELMERVVALLADRPHIVLARIWLLERGDLCSSCHMETQCRSREKCLHLVASAGLGSAPNVADWSRIDGDYRRIPLGVGKVGRVAAQGEAIVVRDYASDPSWNTRYSWTEQLGIRGLNAQPIKFKDQILGVISVFTLIPTPREGPAWMRIFADQIAGALVNARAFEEIEQLRAHVELENAYLREEVREARALGDLIGGSSCMRQLEMQIQKVAPTDATVLILGESGTGKELVARELHRRSGRSNHPLIRINCASVPRELYESEFFGHAKGAFTGAIKDRAGRFEAADGGTLLLDEVGEIPSTLQSKFLRVLQERQYERVGEERTRTVDVRILAATNRDLKKEVEEGRFREDLYYRLNVFPITVPPLRDRKEDIPLLTQHFLQQAAVRLHLPLATITESNLRVLRSYHWPGNVRELQNATERALILAQNGVLHFDLPAEGTRPSFLLTLDNPSDADQPRILSDAEMRLRDRENISEALRRSEWKIHGRGGAAELLGVKPTTLVSRIKKLGLKRPSQSGERFRAPAA